jgi:hypothetical protein
MMYGGGLFKTAELINELTVEGGTIFPRSYLPTLRKHERGCYSMLNLDMNAAVNTSSGKDDVYLSS